MKRRHLSHCYVEYMPKDLSEGMLYISRRFNTASHLCCCGCGNKVVTPLNPAKWHLTDHGATVSLSPSIGNGAFPCRSHYWIRQGAVDWYPPMTDQQTARAQRRDEYASQVYTGERAPPPVVPKPHAPLSAPKPRGWWSRFLDWLGFK